MRDSFYEKYKVHKDAIQLSYEKQLGLKANKEYEYMTDKAIINILNYFSKKYPGVVIEVPRSRVKSPKSILNKTKKLQIERLSKLYAIEGISNEEKLEIYNLLKERIYEKPIENQKEILESIQNIIYKPIEEINIEEDVQNTIIDELSTSTKTALLRILVSKIENSNISNKDKILEMLDREYGQTAATMSKIPEKDIIKYSSIEDTRKTKRRINILHNEQYYLKSKDLRGMKIIISDFDDNFKTDNKKIEEFLEKKKEASLKEKKSIYNNRCCVELAKEFIMDICNNQELLQQCGMRVMPYSVKYKNKTNGYEANHMKFEFLDKPDYSFEVQIKSEYIEQLSHSNGSAAHENRPGKEREFPHLGNSNKFMQELKFTLPEYTTYIQTEKGFVPHKCNLKENMLNYFKDKIDIKSEEYKKALKIIDKNEELSKAI